MGKSEDDKILETLENTQFNYKNRIINFINEEIMNGMPLTSLESYSLSKCLIYIAYCVGIKNDQDPEEVKRTLINHVNKVHELNNQEDHD